MDKQLEQFLEQLGFINTQKDECEWVSQCGYPVMLINDDYSDLTHPTKVISRWSISASYYSVFTRYFKNGAKYIPFSQNISFSKLEELLAFLVKCQYPAAISMERERKINRVLK